MFRPRNADGGPMIGALMISVMVLFIGLSAVTSRIGPAAIPIWFMSMGALVLIGRGKIGAAIAARIHPSSDQTGEVEAVVPAEVYAELDELRARMAEIEERQDFSERLLSQRSEPGKEST